MDEITEEIHGRWKENFQEKDEPNTSAANVKGPMQDMFGRRFSYKMNQEEEEDESQTHIGWVTVSEILSRKPESNINEELKTDKFEGIIENTNSGKDNFIPLRFDELPPEEDWAPVEEVLVIKENDSKETDYPKFKTNKTNEKNMEHGPSHLANSKTDKIEEKNNEQVLSHHNKSHKREGKLSKQENVNSPATKNLKNEIPMTKHAALLKQELNGVPEEQREKQTNVGSKNESSIKREVEYNIPKTRNEILLKNELPVKPKISMNQMRRESYKKEVGNYSNEPPSKTEHSLKQKSKNDQPSNESSIRQSKTLKKKELGYKITSYSEESSESNIREFHQVGKVASLVNSWNSNVNSVEMKAKDPFQRRSSLPAISLTDQLKYNLSSRRNSLMPTSFIDDLSEIEIIEKK